MEREQHHAKGLSFLEVVIIAVMILIMAAILLPIFAKPCINVTKAHCQNNVKECAIALQQYCQDYDDMLPSSIMVSYSKKWNRADYVKFATIRGEIPVKEGVKAQTYYQLLYPYIAKHNSPFCCEDTSDRSNPRSQVSYWYKLAIDKAWYGEGCSAPCRRLSDFRRCRDQVIFYEQKGFHSPVRATLFTKRISGLKNGVSINVAYLDSHVKNITLVNCNKSAESKVWTTDPTAPGEPAYFNYDTTKSNGNTNPPPPHIPTTYIDPNKYIDRL